MDLIGIGDVVRLFEGAYGDATVVKIAPDADGVLRADVVRPSALAHMIGGECHGWLVGTEEVKGVAVDRLELAEPRGKYGSPNRKVGE